MEIKHLILVRFYCIKLSKNIFDENLLNEGYKNMINFLIPSLNNQTDKNFTLVLLKHENSNFLLNKILELKKLCKFDVEIINFIDLEKYISKLNKEKIILSRIDHDDCIRNDCVSIIKQNINYDTDLFYIGFEKGFTQDINKKYELYEFNASYGKIGSMSIMISLFINWNKLQINPYKYNHTKIVQLLKEEFNLQNENIIINSFNRMFIYNQTGTNDHLTYSNKTQWSNLKCKLNKSQITKLFGI